MITGLFSCVIMPLQVWNWKLQNWVCFINAMCVSNDPWNNLWCFTYVAYSLFSFNLPATSTTIFALKIYCERDMKLQQIKEHFHERTKRFYTSLITELSIDFFTIGVSVKLPDRSLHGEEQKKICQKLPPVGIETRTSRSLGQCLTNWARQESVGQGDFWSELCLFHVPLHMLDFVHF